MTHILLVGNPNCGKTTLFNALTGENQRVGNWPGVTVEKKTGTFTVGTEAIQVTDLPGIYTLVTLSQGASLDEQIAAQAVAQSDADLIINVLDACHLERHLYLTSQLLELGKPMIVVLNMSDIADLRGIQIDQQSLSKQLNCPVVSIQAHKQIGLSDLQQMILGHQEPAIPLRLGFTPDIQQTLMQIEGQLIVHHDDPGLVTYLARRILEGETVLVKKDLFLQISIPSDMDIAMADARYQAVHDLVTSVQVKGSDASDYLTAKLDRFVLHRIWSIPIFFAVMYVMFLFAVNVGGAFQEFFDMTTDAIFVHGTASVLQQLQAPSLCIALLANGVGKGINTTLTFIPVIASMFFFLSLLETSGYMSRAAFVVDKAMRALGLPGKAFVPMIVGFGCNVPAIMAARTLDSEHDRLLTILMAPFMSCSARLAIYAVFVAAFFPQGGQNIVFSLYLIGILMAVLTGFLLRNTMLKGQYSPLILELPTYHKPSLSRLLKETTLRLRYFIWRAGVVIIPVCLILGTLNALTIDGFVSTEDASKASVLSWIAQGITPIFSPMGLHPDNWPATVGLLSGMLSKEVVVGTLNTLYAQMGQVGQSPDAGFDVLGSVQTALWTIPHNLAGLGSAFWNPVAASAPIDKLSAPLYGVMYEHFDGQIGAYAYLLFILLYIPCVSTMAVIRQEASRQLMWFSVAWSLIVAYSVAVLFYQFATIQAHPEQTFAWLLGISLSIFGFVLCLRVVAQRQGGRYAVTNS